MTDEYDERMKRKQQRDRLAAEASALAGQPHEHQRHDPARSTMSDGYAAGADPKEKRRVTSQAAAYQANEQYERLLKQPELLDTLPPDQRAMLRTELGYYKEAKAAHKTAVKRGWID